MDRSPLARIDKQWEDLRPRLDAVPAAARREFDERLRVSWIYHDSAIEGMVLSYPEIKASIDDRIISDSTLIPSYDDVRCYRDGLDLIRELAGRRKLTITVETLKKIHAAVSPESGGKAVPYRRDNPLHRSYFHEIAAPDKIGYLLRRLADWLGSDAARRTHPVLRAIRAHFRLMQVYPWTKRSGRTARLLMNLILVREGYLPAVLHAIDRQRYYESLRVPPGLTEAEQDEADALGGLVLAALATAQESARRFLMDAGRLRAAS